MNSTIICHGRILPQRCACGSVADYLCDYPLGGFRPTCDLPLCESCRRQNGDHDYCPAHAQEAGLPDNPLQPPHL